MSQVENQRTLDNLTIQKSVLKVSFLDVWIALAWNLDPHCIWALIFSW